MNVLRRHPLVRADLSAAFNRYENQQPGLGVEFAADFFTHYRQLMRDAELYAIRFADVRRLNLDRFPHGVFYVVRPPEIWLLGVLHASRDTKTILAERRRFLQD